jgi:hypothetical protein
MAASQKPGLSSAYIYVYIDIQRDFGGEMPRYQPGAFTQGGTSGVLAAARYGLPGHQAGAVK